MVMMPGTLTEENEATYDQLISLIENSQDRLALIIVGCDDRGVRDRVIERYEAEAKVAQIRSYRIVLGENLSLRSGLASLAETEVDLREGKAAVFTVTGADLLMRVKSDPEMEQSELDAFFGYLQWTREGLREFRYPIVLWVSLRILQEMGRRAPDFWSWRKAVLRFGQEDQRLVTARRELSMRLDDTDDDDEFLPPLEELLAEVEELEKTSPDSQGLPTLYAKLGQVYARRISQGEAKDLVAEQNEAVMWFERAIERMQHQGSESSLVAVFEQYGNLLVDQFQFTKAAQAYENSLALAKKYKDKRAKAKALNGLGILQRALGNYSKAIAFHNQSLEIDQMIDNKKGIAASLSNLGAVYEYLRDYQKMVAFHNQSLEIKQVIGSKKGIAASLGNLGDAYKGLEDYSRAIDFHTQSLEIRQIIDDKQGISCSLSGLGSVYKALGSYSKAIDFYDQANEINRIIDDRQSTAATLGNIGIAYSGLGKYSEAIDFYSQALKKMRTIGDRYNEAIVRRHLAYAQTKLDNRWSAKQNLEKAKAIYTELKLDHEVEECDGQIYAINQIISSQPIAPMPVKAPIIVSPRSASHHRSIPILRWWLWFYIGIAIFLLITWLLR
jgi:tetratricopeptide (TPR) repeat protein